MNYIIHVCYIEFFEQPAASVYMIAPRGLSEPLLRPERSFHAMTSRARKSLGWRRIRGDGDDGSVLERDAVKLASARI